jgi:hypothetical protein
MQVDLKQYEERINHGSWWRPDWINEYNVAWRITLTEVEKLALKKYPPKTVLYKIRRTSYGEAEVYLDEFITPIQYPTDAPRLYPELSKEIFRDPLDRELFIQRLKTSIFPALKTMLEVCGRPPSQESETLEF